MIVVTGAAGFISSFLVRALNVAGHSSIVIVDDFTREDKNLNLVGKKIVERVERSHFFAWIKGKEKAIQFIFHLGARTDTTEFNKAIFDELNLGYSKKMWALCTEFGIPLVYASSAATYGLGEFGFSDEHSLCDKLKPLNPYGESKNEFDRWVITQKTTPPFWAGLKFFNVYGPNEYHKGRMASVIFHAYRQISATGKMRLFASHNPEYSDGGQLRDFIFVSDVVDVCLFLMDRRPANGIFNLGTGVARTFNDLAKATFSAMDKKPTIEYIPTPEDIRDKYQYFTEAEMSKLLGVGYSKPFTSLEDGVRNYVRNYLQNGSYF